MGYACPVCEAPQADGIHLANHLAFTALLGRTDHAAWLDEHAPGWHDDGPETLAERVAPHATEIDAEPATEPVGTAPDAAVEEATGGLMPTAPPASPAEPDPEVGAVIEKARELTRERREDDDG